MGIYKPQLNTLLSVNHRGTGIIMSLVAWALGCVLLILPHEIEHYFQMLEGLNLPSWFYSTARWLLALPLCYHGCNGIRHLIWDTGRYLKMSEVYMTGRILFVIAMILTTLTAYA